MINRRQIIVLLVLNFAVGLFVVLGLSIIKDIKGNVSISVDYKNVDGFVVSNSVTQEMLYTIRPPQNVLNLEKYKSYTISYIGSDGYQDGKVTLFTSDDVKSLNIDPYYSDQRLSDLLASEISSINSSINKYVINKDDFLIREGRLFGYGDWYGTILEYKGNDYFNSDNLKIILKKDDDKWIVAAKPYLLFNKFEYPDIPEEVLSGVNKL